MNNLRNEEIEKYVIQTLQDVPLIKKDLLIKDVVIRFYSYDCITFGYIQTCLQNMIHRKELIVFLSDTPATNHRWPFLALPGTTIILKANSPIEPAFHYPKDTEL